jgi:hypothetical protein
MGLVLADSIQLRHKQFNVGVNVLFKLANGFGTKSVRDSLAFAGVVVPVSGIE